MTTTLSISTAAPRFVPADAVVIGLIKTPDGPALAPGTADIDEALGGTLTATLTVLGATGQAEEITRLPSAGALAAPLIAAVGLGPADPAALDPETLRRAAGRRCPGAHRGGLGQPPGKQPDARRRRAGPGIALALPARDAAEAEAVALGGLLGGYSFTRYRPAATPPSALTVLTPADVPGPAHAPRRWPARCRWPATWSTQHRPTWCPAALAEEAERVAAAAGLSAEVLDEKALSENGYGGILGVGQGSVHPPRLARLEYSPPPGDRRRPRRWSSWARASRSTRAGCR